MVWYNNFVDKSPMLQTFIITLREGVEASLVIAIAIAYLRKTGRLNLLSTVYQAIGSAVLASFVLAWVFTRFHVTEEAYEGWTYIASAVFVGSMVVWMNRHARHMKGEIESLLEKGAQKGEGTGSRWGIFFFVFLMIFREGVETVLLLSAAAMNTSGVLELFGSALGLGLAVLFGLSFIRGTVRVNLRSFFKMTTVILMVVVFQLLLSGLHELSEGQIIPGSPVEMALIGPIVRNDTFFFIAILALAGTMILWEWRSRRPVVTTGLEGAALRKAKWSASREKLWMVTSCIGSALFILMVTAEFIYAKSATELSVATPLTVTGDFAKIPVASVSDGVLHRFSVESDGVSVRIIVIQRPDKSLVAAFDACEICGAKGFYQKGGTVVCKNCASAIVNSSIGEHGGCNPIPLPSEVQGDQLVIPAAKIFKGARMFSAAK
jgi:high-affinity iron transporter